MTSKAKEQKGSNEAPLSDHQEVAVLMMAHKPELPFSAIAKRVGVNIKTLTRWRALPAFSAALAAEREIHHANVVQSLECNGASLSDSVTSAVLEVLPHVPAVYVAFAAMAQNADLDAKDRIAAGKEVTALLTSLKAYEVTLTSWAKVQLGGPGHGGSGGSSSSSAPPFDDPDLDPDRPRAPLPEPPFDPKWLDMMLEKRDEVKRFYQGIDIHHRPLAPMARMVMGESTPTATTKPVTSDASTDQGQAEPLQAREAQPSTAPPRVLSMVFPAPTKAPSPPPPPPSCVMTSDFETHEHKHSEDLDILGIAQK